jgi:hypothetical protein
MRSMQMSSYKVENPAKFAHVFCHFRAAEARTRELDSNPRPYDDEASVVYDNEYSLIIDIYSNKSFLYLSNLERLCSKTLRHPV